MIWCFVKPPILRPTFSSCPIPLPPIFFLLNRLLPSSLRLSLSAPPMLSICVMHICILGPPTNSLYSRGRGPSFVHHIYVRLHLRNTTRDSHILHGISFRVLTLAFRRRRRASSVLPPPPSSRRCPRVSRASGPSSPHQLGGSPYTRSNDLG
uniref:Uncharacterized protein n=1 Tax=Triticum urartu TaxID=4572 RepID=A0A8R7UTK9_TRIUA